MTDNLSNSFSTPVAGVPAGLLAGRVAVITGASAGIGAATARRFASAGAAVALLGRRSGLLDDLAATLRAEGSAEVLPVAVDVTDPAALTAAASTIRATLGRPDLVVANAGVMLGAPFDEADTAEWDQMIDVNLRGLLATGRVFIADLLDAAEAGRAADLVNLGSTAAEVIFADYPVYGATKAAVTQLTRNLRASLGPRGVRVRSVDPAFAVTELGADMAHEATRVGLDEMRSAITTITAEDVADAITYSVAVPARVNIAELTVVPTELG
ncbi:short-chain dehydrogenase/reductase SDR [Streptomyces bingchenggensis BCW-1]|uniref:Short-chain dehydrogenase/reductase SDR n=1 Tax=Streptomyces bingchenggensis (strain BCW-1) TaxID=749414 RepID=D7CBG8_STRBB|nr:MULTISPECIES: SDR family oxidoreductase [Streptomyces]ADI12845.1 short-chain dehydrogenase/reductase SDR [Streptomyces bingchenggensis BCW-1]